MSKYQAWHDAIIFRSRTRKKLACYGEWHHVIPKSLGGHDAPSNMAHLTYREHFLIHWILTKIVSGGSLRRMQRALRAVTLPMQGRPAAEDWQIRIGLNAVRDLEEDPGEVADWRLGLRRSKGQVQYERVQAFKAAASAQKPTQQAKLQDIEDALAKNPRPSSSELARMATDLLKHHGGIAAKFNGWPLRGSKGAKAGRQEYRRRQQEAEQNHRGAWRVGLLPLAEPQRINQPGNVSVPRAGIETDGNSQPMATP